jgi:hypothetical protein
MRDIKIELTEAESNTVISALIEALGYLWRQRQDNDFTQEHLMSDHETALMKIFAERHKARKEEQDSDHRSSRRSSKISKEVNGDKFSQNSND